MKKLLFLGTLLCGVAFADLTPGLIDISSGGVACGIFGSGPACRYNYVADTGGTTLVANQSFFTLYDLTGLVGTPGSIMAPTNWSVTLGNTGRTPTGATVVDNATLPNITFTYTGPTTSTVSSVSGFSLLSSDTGIQTGKFSSQSVMMTQSGQGVVVCVGPLDVPAPGQNEATVPEPVSVAMLGSGMLAMGLFGSRLRRNRQ